MKQLTPLTTASAAPNSPAASTWLGHSNYGGTHTDVYDTDVSKWIASKTDDARGHLASLLQNRLEERFFKPHLERAPDTGQYSFRQHPGFILAASACMMIESLQRYRMSFLAKSTKGHGTHLFKAFFSAADHLANSKVYKRARTNAFVNCGITANHSLSFFEDIRCGILHVGEIRNGWKLRRYGYSSGTTPVQDPFDSSLPICDPDENLRAIYADRLLVCVFEEVKECCTRFSEGDDWESFSEAMQDTIRVCQPGER